MILPSWAEGANRGPYRFLHEGVQSMGYGAAFVSPMLPARWAETLRGYLNEVSAFDMSISSGRLYRTEGDILTEDFPWLYSWYVQQGLDMMRAAVGDPAVEVRPLPDALNGYLSMGPQIGPTPPMTANSYYSAVLFASGLAEGAGGELELHPPGCPRAIIAPEEGRCVFFDSALTSYVFHPVRPTTSQHYVLFSYRTRPREALSPPPTTSVPARVSETALVGSLLTRWSVCVEQEGVVTYAKNA